MTSSALGTIARAGTSVCLTHFPDGCSGMELRLAYPPTATPAGKDSLLAPGLQQRTWTLPHKASNPVLALSDSLVVLSEDGRTVCLAAVNGERCPCSYCMLACQVTTLAKLSLVMTHIRMHSVWGEFILTCQ